jgi:hypothetical protein
MENLELESFAIGGGTIDNHSQPLIRLNLSEYFTLGGSAQIQNTSQDFKPIIHLIITDLEDLKDMRSENIQGICLKNFNTDQIPKLKNILRDWNVTVEVMDIKSLDEPQLWLDVGVRRFRLFRPFFEWVNFEFCLPTNVNETKFKFGENP